MKLRFERLSTEEWLAIDRTAQAPTFFAKPAWAVAIGRIFPDMMPWPLRCKLDDGGEAFVPLVSVRGRLGWKILHGMPFDGYTALLTPKGLGLAADVAAKVLEELMFVGDEVLLNLWPFDGPRLPLADVRIAAETSAMDISGGVEAALSRIAPKSRRMAGQALRKGASCSIEPWAQALPLYYGLLEEAATQRWHREAPTIREDFLREVCAQGGADVEMWIVRYEGDAIAGGVALYGSQEVSLWTTASKPGMEILRPHNLLHATIIEHAARRGVRWYNLNSSSNLEGVLRFKRALGATTMPYEIVGHRSTRFKVVQGLRRLAPKRA